MAKEREAALEAERKQVAGKQSSSMVMLRRGADNGGNRRGRLLYGDLTKGSYPLLGLSFVFVLDRVEYLPWVCGTGGFPFRECVFLLR